MSDPDADDVTLQDLRSYRAEAEASMDEPLSPAATRPARVKVLSVRLNPEEFDALGAYAEQRELPASSLVRGWVLDQLRADAAATSSGEDESAAAAVDRIVRELEVLRRRLAG